RLLVNAAFAAGLPLEVLDDVRHVDLRAVDAGFPEGPVEQAAGGSDERMPFQIFGVAGLFTDEHHRRALFSLDVDGLRPAFPEVTRLTGGGRCLKFSQRRPGRHEGLRRLLPTLHDEGESATVEPTHVNCLLTLTPSIFPRESRR